MEQPHYVRVAVNIPAINSEFDYSVPENFFGNPLPGCLVEIPFRNQTMQGVITRHIEIPEVPDVKPLSGLVDPIPVLSPELLKLAVWMSKETLTPVGICIDMMLPPGLVSQADTLYELTIREVIMAGLEQTETRIIQQLVNRGGLRLHQLEAAIPNTPLQGSLRRLEQRGMISSKSVLLPPRVRPKYVRTASLACPIEIINQRIGNLSIFPAVQQRRRRALEYLMQEPLPVEVTWVYAASGCKLDDLIVLQEMDLIVLNETEVWRDPLKNVEPLKQGKPGLTEDQQAAWNEIKSSLEWSRQGEMIQPILIQGVTGSGKTELYMRAVEDTLSAGKQAIVLVPEISLTPLAVQRFLTRFPGQVGLIHSKLTPGERYDTWRRARAGVLPVIIGPRSALFTPLNSLGLIVIDECHDESYYQREPAPAYATQRAASRLSELSGAALIMGSATPDITQQYYAHKGTYQHIFLKRRIITSEDRQEGRLAEETGLPPVEVVDMRAELKAGVRSMFSRTLHEALQKVLDAQEQAILFLNRRGSSTFIFCYECGHSIRCPRCEIPLTFHSVENNLLCHHCGYTRQMPKTCPNCNSDRIRGFGLGTERVEAELKNEFPEARVLRWDAETTRTKDANDIILGHFTAHHADILVGTQMVAKGHDFPLVTLVGILLAESGLNLPDYRSPERTFQLVTQVAGRAGRSEHGGKVILQTYLPEHYAIQSAAGHDIEAFYDFEINQRNRLHFPPFIRLARLIFSNLTEDACRNQAEKIQSIVARHVEQENMGATTVGNALPCFFARESGYYRYQVIIRSPDPARVLQDLPLGDCKVQMDPVDLL